MTAAGPVVSAAAKPTLPESSVEAPIAATEAMADLLVLIRTPRLRSYR